MATSEAMICTGTPEEQELARKEARLADLEATLLDRELELATLQAELDGFDRRYFDEVGCRMVLLDKIEARIARALAGEPDDAGAFDMAPEEVTTTPPPTPELKSLFRQVARALHPDLVLDEQEKARRTALMADANAAYKAGNSTRLQELLREGRDDPDAIKGTDTVARLVRCIRRIAQTERRLEALRTEIDQRRRSDLHHLWEAVNNAGRTGRDLLREMRNDLDKRIVAAKQRLADIVVAKAAR